MESETDRLLYKEVSKLFVYSQMTMNYSFLYLYGIK